MSQDKQPRTEEDNQMISLWMAFLTTNSDSFKKKEMDDAIHMTIEMAQNENLHQEETTDLLEEVLQVKETNMERTVSTDAEDDFFRERNAKMRHVLDMSFLHGCVPEENSDSMPELEDTLD